MLDVVENMPF